MNGSVSRFLLALTLAAVAAAGGCVGREASAPDPATAAGDGWVSLFNGRDLDGWTPKFAKHEAGLNYKDTFRVENGLLKVSYDAYEKFDGEFGHLF